MSQRMRRRHITQNRLRNETTRHVRLLTRRNVRNQRIRPIIVQPCLTNNLTSRHLRLYVTTRPKRLSVISLTRLVGVRGLMMSLIFRHIIPNQGGPNSHTQGNSHLMMFRSERPLITLLRVRLIRMFMNGSKNISTLLRVNLTRVQPLSNGLNILFRRKRGINHGNYIPSTNLNTRGTLNKSVRRPRQLLNGSIRPIRSVVRRHGMQQLTTHRANAMNALTHTRNTSVVFCRNRDEAPFFGNSYFPFPTHTTIFTTRIWRRCGVGFKFVKSFLQREY